MKTKARYKTFFLAFVMLSAFTSCSLERKIAKEYITNDTTRSVLVIPPDLVFKKSLKEWTIDSAARLDSRTLDSLLWTSSLYLQYVDDSAFIDSYLRNYTSEMEALGFRVYGQDSLLSFLSGKPDAFIINIAQLELEEYVMPIREEAEFGEYIYSEVVDLNAVNLNSWFEISRVNGEEEKALFFTSHYLTDGLEGLFKQNPFSGEVQFSYSIDTLLVEEIYLLAALAGKIYAGYTFDFLLNKYIDSRVEEEGQGRSEIYYHFDRRRRFLGSAGDDERFIPME